MNDRKLLILFSVGLLIVGGALWVLALTVVRPNQTSHTVKASPNTTTPSPLAPSSASASPATVQRMVETPAETLKRAKRYLEPPITRQSIHTARAVIGHIPTSSVEYKEAQRRLNAAEATVRANEAQEVPRLREQLQAEYRSMLSEANPHLNYITTNLGKQKGGVALWGVHEYFGRYTFSIGGDGPTVSAWIDRNRNYLKKAGIVRVGVRSREGWGGSCWFDI